MCVGYCMNCIQCSRLPRDSDLSWASTIFWKPEISASQTNTILMINKARERNLTTANVLRQQVSAKGRLALWVSNRHLHFLLATLHLHPCSCSNLKSFLASSFNSRAKIKPSMDQLITHVDPFSCNLTYCTHDWLWSSQAFNSSLP